MKRTKEEIEEKLEEVTNKLKGDDTRGPFFYWLGFKRALEWILRSEYCNNLFILRAITRG